MSAAACFAVDSRVEAGPGPKRGLVVDADPAFLTFAAAALRKAGYDILTAGSANQALRELRLWPESIQFVITDSELEGERWSEIVASVRALFPAARILTTTRRSLHRCEFERRSDAVLEKPMTAAELVVRVQGLFGIWAGRAPSFQDAPVGALVVGTAPAAYQSLARIFAGEGWVLRRAPGWREAWTQPRRDPVRVLIVENDLPDGGWRELLDRVNDEPGGPRLIVAARHADERLWSEVLNLGAFDLVTIPFDAHEVRHVVSHAWDSWQDEWAGGRRRSRR